MEVVDLTAVSATQFIVGYSFSLFAGALFIWLLIDKAAWPYVSKAIGRTIKPKRSLSSVLGVLERASITTAVLAGAPSWIGVWLAIKVAAQWNHWQDENRASFNVFLIGNLLSIFFAVGGACMILGGLPSFAEK